MGYFSNGTEGDMFEEEHCSTCVHNTPPAPDGSSGGCPVMLSHILYAYEECNSKSNAKVMLDLLIERPKDGPQRCVMYHRDAGKVHPSQEKLALG